MKYHTLIFLTFYFLSFFVSSQKTMELTVLFPNDGFELSDSSKNSIDSLLNSLTGKSVKRVEIKGHTDNEGDHDYNMNLSKKRTEKVKSYLIKKDIDSLLILTDFLGENQPVSDEKKFNRRVEINVFYQEVIIEKESCEGTIRYVADQKFDFDIDDDGTMDFSINYKMVGPTVQGNTRYSISGGIRALKDYECLYCSDKSNYQLRKGDTIYLNQNEDCMWTDFKLTAVKYNKEEKKWNTLNKKDPTIQYFAIKNIQNNRVKLGWIKLKFDVCTGKFEVIGKKFTKSNFIIIDQ